MKVEIVGGPYDGEFRLVENLTNVVRFIYPVFLPYTNEEIISPMADTPIIFELPITYHNGKPKVFWKEFNPD